MSQSTALATAFRKEFADADLAAFVTYDDVVSALATREIPLESVADYGTGFVLVDKSNLVGVPFLIVQWRFNKGEYAEEFASVEAITKHNDKVIFNDGSTGVRDQLRDITNRRAKAGHPSPTAGLLVTGGLSRTSYFYNENTGEVVSVKPDGAGKEWKPASTYYLAG